MGDTVKSDLRVRLQRAAVVLCLSRGEHDTYDGRRGEAGSVDYPGDISAGDCVVKPFAVVVGAAVRADAREFVLDANEGRCDSGEVGWWKF